MYSITVIKLHYIFITTFKHFLAFANIFDAGRVGVAYKIANKIEHFWTLQIWDF